MKGQGKKEDAGKYGKGKGKGKAPLRKDQWACMGCGWHNFNDRASCHNWNCAQHHKGKITGKGPERGGCAQRQGPEQTNRRPNRGY